MTCTGQTLKCMSRPDQTYMHRQLKLVLARLLCPHVTLLLQACASTLKGYEQCFMAFQCLAEHAAILTQPARVCPSPQSHAIKSRRLQLPADEVHRRVLNALDLVGMAAYLERGCHTLSGGQKQRVAIAGALVQQPQVFSPPMLNHALSCHHQYSN